MRNLYPLNNRRLLYTYYTFCKYNSSMELRRLYSYFNCNNYCSIQVNVWVDVYFNLESLSLLFNNIHWICLLSGSYSGVFRFFSLSSLCLFNMLLGTEWNGVGYNTN